jgi:hypothetical protein
VDYDEFSASINGILYSLPEPTRQSVSAVDAPWRLDTPHAKNLERQYFGEVEEGEEREEREKGDKGDEGDEGGGRETEEGERKATTGAMGDEDGCAVSADGADPREVVEGGNAGIGREGTERGTAAHVPHVPGTRRSARQPLAVSLLETPQTRGPSRRGKEVTFGDSPRWKAKGEENEEAAADAVDAADAKELVGLEKAEKAEEEGNSSTAQHWATAETMRLRLPPATVVASTNATGARYAQRKVRAIGVSGNDGRNSGTEHRHSDGDDGDDGDGAPSTPTRARSTDSTGTSTGITGGVSVTSPKKAWTPNNATFECQCTTCGAHSQHEHRKAKKGGGGSGGTTTPNPPPKPTRFGVMNRRHHCRQCGIVVCWKCSKARRVVAGYGVTLQRVCDECAMDLSLLIWTTLTANSDRDTIDVLYFADAVVDLNVGVTRTKAALLVEQVDRDRDGKSIC